MHPDSDQSSLRRRAKFAHLAVVLFTVVAGALVVSATTAIAPSAANAVCADTMTGNWRNINTSTSSLTRVELVMKTCGDVRQCDADTGICTSVGTTYGMRAYGKCHPTDCNWGERTTADAGGGWQRATYAYAWATKHVWVKPYAFHGRTYLRVWVHTDFTTTDGRQDYTRDEWMLK